MWISAETRIMQVHISKFRTQKLFMAVGISKKNKSNYHSIKIHWFPDDSFPATLRQQKKKNGFWPKPAANTELLRGPKRGAITKGMVFAIQRELYNVFLCLMLIRNAELNLLRIISIFSTTLRSIFDSYFDDYTPISISGTNSIYMVALRFR